jgi:hypothetical protein
MEIEDCIFCYTPLDDESSCTIIPCNHKFHTTCLQTWENTSYKKQCIRCFKYYGVNKNFSLLNEDPINCDHFLLLYLVLFLFFVYLSDITCNEIYINRFINSTIAVFNIFPLSFEQFQSPLRGIQYIECTPLSWNDIFVEKKFYNYPSSKRLNNPV